MRFEIDTPLARALVDELGRDGAIEVVRGIVADDPAAIERAGTAMCARIERNECGDVVEIQCVFPLREPSVDPDGRERDDGIFWDNRGVVARGATLPQAAAANIVGGPMTAVFDHPYLAGLVVTSVDTDEDALVVDAEQSLIDVDHLEELL